MLAAISAIEGLKQFQTGGASNPWFYVMLGIFIVSGYMYFTRKNKRLDTPDKK
jgi:LPXTG-motif cell wall-anchored protein